MTKLFNQLIQVRISGGNPAAFYFRNRWRFIVSIEKVHVRRDYMDKYRYLDTYRATLRDGIICDLVKTEDGWVLERIWD